MSTPNTPVWQGIRNSLTRQTDQLQRRENILLKNCTLTVLMKKFSYIFEVKDDERVITLKVITVLTPIFYGLR